MEAEKQQVRGEGLTARMDRDFSALETLKQHGDVWMSDGGTWGPVDQSEEEINSAEVDVKC